MIEAGDTWWLLLGPSALSLWPEPWLQPVPHCSRCLSPFSVASTGAALCIAEAECWAARLSKWLVFLKGRWQQSSKIHTSGTVVRLTPAAQQQVDPPQLLPPFWICSCQRGLPAFSGGNAGQCPTRGRSEEPQQLLTDCISFPLCLSFTSNSYMGLSISAVCISWPQKQHRLLPLLEELG